MSQSEPLTPIQTAKPSWSDLSLTLYLTEFHYDKGRLILRCVAQVGDIYQDEAVLALSSAREPSWDKGDFLFLLYYQK